MKTTRALALALAGALVALPAAAAFRIVPAQPSTFELVNLRMTVDSCVFDASRVRVGMFGGGANHVIVTAPRNQCLLPGEPRVVDILLGAFPAGTYTVAVHDNPSDFSPPYESARFDVTERPEIAVFPPPVRPLTIYTGMWWNPQESGWGLSLNQGASNALFGAWFVYGSNSQPEWFTLQGGQWTSSTRWQGLVYRTTGPFFAGPDFDPRLVLVQAAGTATLDFSQVPGDEDRARFTYTVGGVTATKTISRMAF